VTASLPSAPTFSSLSAAASAAGSTVLMSSGGMSASAVAVMTTVSILRTLARKAALIPRSDPVVSSVSPSEPSRPAAASQQDTTVLLLRGFPPIATEADVAGFLSPFTAKLLFFCKDTTGKPIGDVFAEFSSSTDAKAALSRHNDTLNGKAIQVFPSTLSELRLAITASNPITRDPSASTAAEFVLRMRGLPFR
jgi:hypothetical protein